MGLGPACSGVAEPRPTSSSAMIRSSSSSSLMAEAMMGGVEAGRATSDTARRSFTWGFCTSSSSDSAFCKGQACHTQHPHPSLVPRQLRCPQQAKAWGGIRANAQIGDPQLEPSEKVPLPPGFLLTQPPRVAVVP